MDIVHFIVVHNRDFIRLLWEKPPIVEEKGKLLMKEFNIVKYHAVTNISTAGRNGKLKNTVHMTLYTTIIPLLCRVLQKKQDPTLFENPQKLLTFQLILTHTT